MMNLSVYTILQEYKVEIDPTTECWNYVGRQSGRYPRVTYDKSKYQLHRLSWKLTYGDIPDNLYVCHKCDNTKCCNPSHLFLGTQYDNMQDMVRKGRNSDTSGEFNGRAILDWEVVKFIREDYQSGMPTKRLSEKYKVPPTTITNIVHNYTWVDVKYSYLPIKPLNRSITQGIYDQVMSLRASGRTQESIGKELGISQAGVWRVLSGILKPWRTDGSTE